MKTLLAATLLSVGVSELTPACVYAALTGRESIEASRRFEPGGSFRLENVNGRVTVNTWDENRVLIEAEKFAQSDEELEEIDIDIKGEGDKVTVRTRLPRRRLFFGRGGKVDYRIRLPNRAPVQIETVNGSVVIAGIAGRVQASTVNGSVEIARVSGEVETSTINGSIKATYSKLDSEGHHRLSTTNGSVSLYLPPGASGAFDVRTVNGSIRTDLPLKARGKFGAKRLRGQIGEAHGAFEVRTVNGSVRILEALGDWSSKQ